MRILSALGLCLGLCGEPLRADHSVETNRFTAYLRGDFVSQAADLVTINGVYDFNSRYGSLEVAARTGLEGGDFGLWSYKLEYLTPWFWDHHRLSVRVVKNASYTSQGSSSNTRYAQRLSGVYHPLESLDRFKDVRLGLDLGAAQLLSTVEGAQVLPSTQGSFSLQPMWALRAIIPLSGDREVNLSYSNFDVFDPDPASQPFLQLEGRQTVDGIDWYSYVRYRWNQSIDQFYSLYLTVGLSIPE